MREEQQQGEGVPVAEPTVGLSAASPRRDACGLSASIPHAKEAKALMRRRKRSADIDLHMQMTWGDGGSSGDDFTVRTPDGYLLRVEQMGRGAWWWQVYTPGGGEIDPSCDLTVPSEYIAKRICELFYRLHSATMIASEVVGLRGSDRQGRDEGAGPRSSEDGTPKERDGDEGAGTPNLPH